MNTEEKKPNFFQLVNELKKLEVLQWPDKITVIPDVPSTQDAQNDENVNSINSEQVTFLNQVGFNLDGDFISGTTNPKASVVFTVNDVNVGSTMANDSGNFGFRMPQVYTQGEQVGVQVGDLKINVIAPSTPSINIGKEQLKQINFVTPHGIVVGNGTLVKTAGKIGLHHIPSGYKLADEDSSSHSTQIPESGINITNQRVKKAISNIDDWLNIIGNGPSRRKYAIEAKHFLNHYSMYGTIEPDLYDLVIKQFKESNDLINLKEVQKSNRLPNVVYTFVDNYKSGGIHDYLGSNIFLMTKHTANYAKEHQTYYLPSRKVKGFVDEFFKWLLSNYAKPEARMLNKETGEMDDFYTLEEVQAGNSKKARILGFYKSITGKTEAICGFYNNHIQFLPELQRSTSGMVNPDFKKYDAKSDRPVFFAFDLKDVMNRQKRNYFNLFVSSLRQKPVSIFYSGEKYRIIVKNYVIDMTKFRPNSSQSKTMQGKTRRSYGNLSTDDTVEFLRQNVLEDKLGDFIESNCNTERARQLLGKPENMTEEEFVDFLKENIVKNTSYVIVSKKDKNKITIGSNYYPVTWWVPKSTQNILNNLGIKSGLPPQFMLDFGIESWLSVSDYDNIDQLLENLNNMMGKWNSEMSNYISNWQKKLHAKDVNETFEKIDGVLKGRLKINSDDDYDGYND